MAVVQQCYSNDKHHDLPMSYAREKKKKGKGKRTGRLGIVRPGLPLSSLLHCCYSIDIFGTLSPHIHATRGLLYYGMTSATCHFQPPFHACLFSMVFLVGGAEGLEGRERDTRAPVFRGQTRATVHNGPALQYIRRLSNQAKNILRSTALWCHEALYIGQDEGQAHGHGDARGRNLGQHIYFCMVLTRHWYWGCGFFFFPFSPQSFLIGPPTSSFFLEVMKYGGSDG